jgi:hypothetical protein
MRQCAIIGFAAVETRNGSFRSATDLLGRPTQVESENPHFNEAE